MLRRQQQLLLAPVERLLRSRSILMAVLKAVGRFFSVLGTVLLTVWSYSIWGSAASPLSALLVPGLVCLLLGILTGVVLDRVRLAAQRLLRVYITLLEKEQNLSREVGKL